jgi:hypothetical protein
MHIAVNILPSSGIFYEEKIGKQWNKYIANSCGGNNCKKSSCCNSSGIYEIQLTFIKVDSSLSKPRRLVGGEVNV